MCRYDLRGATNLNSLSQEDYSSIWSPSLSFTNAKIIGGSKVILILPLL